VLNGRKMVNDKFGKMWKEVAMACFKILFQYLSVWTDESHRNISLDSQHLSQELDPWPL
jgi:hypothetical protein